jgi:hypothetical protein
VNGTLPAVTLSAYAFAWHVVLAVLPVLLGLARVALTLARVR